jgi:membrane protease YdiL (CAAX protease family)
MEKEILKRYRHPVLFYVLSIIIPWILWFIAGYISHMEPGNNFYLTAQSVLGIFGLVSPVIIALALMLPDPILWRDFKKRLFNFNAITPFYAVFTCFVMLASVLLAQAISLLFGYNVSQFSLAEDFSFTGGIFSAWFLLLIAPILEELAWHSYGTDCLRKRFTLFTTSMIFAVFWAFWHFPLSFIKDYYQSNVAESGVLYSLNFVISLIPFVILMNWLYFKTGRSIIVVIIFHITAGFFNEIFAIHPMSKVIQTVLLLILSLIILFKERKLFFKLDYDG